MQAFAERDHALYPLICVLRGLGDSLFDHLVAHALIQFSTLRFIAEGLDVVIDLRFPLLFGRGFGIVIKSLRQMFYRFGEGVF